MRKKINTFTFIHETGATFFAPTLFGNGVGASVTGLSKGRPIIKKEMIYMHISCCADFVLQGLVI